MVKNLFLWLFIAVILIFVFSNFGPKSGADQRLSYSDFLRQVQQGNVTSVTIDNRMIDGVTQGDQTFNTYIPMEDPTLLGELVKKGVNVKGKPPEQQSLLMHIFINWFPMLLLIGVWVFFMRQMQGGGGRGALSFGRSRARLLGEDQV